MPVELGKTTRSWHLYLISSISILLVLLLVAVAIYFRGEIRNLQTYGYLGIFLVAILSGITIIPVPTLVVVFTLGHVLNPLYVGLVAGLGEALGGITVYLTGAGMGNIVRPVRSRFWSKGEAIYRRLGDWVGSKGGAWVVLFTSAMVISPFYFAGLAAGSLRMGWLRFFLISWAGKTIKGLSIAFAGYWGLYFFLRWIGG